MFEKIKGAMQAKEEIDVINKNLEENNKLISELKNELESLKKELSERIGRAHV